MYSGLGEPLNITSSSPTEGLVPDDSIDLTQGPYIPPSNSGTATALLRASITANAPGSSDVLSYGTLADKAALIPTWGWIAGAGVFALLALGGRRR